MNKRWLKRRKRVFEIIEVGNDLDWASRLYDFINVFAIVLNIAASIMYTYESIRTDYGDALAIVEYVTVAFFALDYILRLWTAKIMYMDMQEYKAIGKYVFSFGGIVDLLSFLPYYLPAFIPGGTVAFRMIRIVRIFRLFRVNAYYDSLSIIKEVLYEKRQQLISSVFIILVLMIGASLCMYSIEHEAQPEVFSNAFSGIWWASSTLLTVGYGDIYPITTLGKLFGIVITFLGVGMVAIPTGIISAGFVNQYSMVKKKHEFGYEEDMHFIKVPIRGDDDWLGKKVADLRIPQGVIIAVIKRNEDIIIPRGDFVIEKNDVIVIGAEPFEEKEHINLKEIILKEKHPWCGIAIKDLDISRHSIIVLVKRKNKTLIPNGKLVLTEGDRVFMYTKLYMSDSIEIQV